MAKQVTTEGFQKIPTHVAVIMDGNGRWAAKRGLPRVAGHRAGTENLRRVITASVEFGIQYLTIYAFSTENWERPEDEVSGLMSILAEVIDRELMELHKEGVQLHHIGHLEQLNPALRQKVLHAVELTKNNNRLVLTVAFNYGGRDEILCAIRAMMEEGVKPEDVTVATFNHHLLTANIPEPDLVIRTSGEMRTSNFLIWQAAYAEWYFTPILWPDFNKEELRNAIIDYGKRERRYGRVSSQCNDGAVSNAG